MGIQYAIINNNNIVGNVIAADENTIIYSNMIRIDQLDVIPGINWSYNNGVFTPPPSIPPIH